MEIYSQLKHAKTMSDDDTYHPIDCTDHSKYELAIMRQQKLHIAWKNTHNSHNITTIKPLDLQTWQGEEFLIAESLQGQPLKIRLDHITRCKPVEK